jgi:hypothetical protein
MIPPALWQLIGWAMILLSAVVLVTSFPLKGTPPMVPELVSLFGVAFGAGYLLVQLLVVVALRTARAAGLFLLAAGGGLGLGAMSVWLDLWRVFADGQVGVARHLVCSAAVIGGLGMGAGLVRYWILPTDSSEHERDPS